MDESELERLLLDYGNAAFDCGEWDDDNDEPYDTLTERYRAAREALREFYRQSLR